MTYNNGTLHFQSAAWDLKELQLVSWEKTLVSVWDNVLSQSGRFPQNHEASCTTQTWIIGIRPQQMLLNSLTTGRKSGISWTHQFYSAKPPNTKSGNNFQMMEGPGRGKDRDHVFQLHEARRQRLTLVAWHRLPGCKQNVSQNERLCLRKDVNSNTWE